MLRRRALLGLLGAGAIAAVVLGAGIAGAAPPPGHNHTQTPIKHLVVIFQENVSFDHYFGTYPTAANTDGSTFTARPGTPAVNGLLPATDSSIPAALQHSTDLTQTNPNSALPKRLDSTPDGAAGSAGGQETCDQDHNYSDEQQSFDGNADGSAFAMDLFVQSVGKASGKAPNGINNCVAATVMDYYDGNSTTALWNYAQHYSMSDNSFDTTFGPSAPGAINLISGDTGGVDTNTAHQSQITPSKIATPSAPNADLTSDGNGRYSLTSDAQPFYDDCSTRDAVALTGTNIGDELNAAGLSWGWFQGGFRPSKSFADAAAATGHTGQATSQFIADEFAGKFPPPGNITATHKDATSTTAEVPGLPSGLGTAADQGLCNTYHAIGVALGPNTVSTPDPTDPNANPDNTIPSNAPWGYKDDYIAHHEPFQYYASTANPHHLSVDDGKLHGGDSLSTIGDDTQTFGGGYGVSPQFDTPNHNYDTADFDALVAAINDHKLPPDALPAVTFLKAPGYEDGHAQYSNPRDEQAFVVNEVNALEKSPDWSSTAVVVNYDDSDGWYDHYYSGVTNPSNLVGADNLTPTVKGLITAANPTSQHCGSGKALGPGTNGQQGRCGFSSRLPMIAISPCAAPDQVDHNMSDQASIVNFIEYNWGLPAISGSFDQALKAKDQSEGIPFDMAGLFDFSNCNVPAIQLDPATGQIAMANSHLHGDNEGSDWANGDLSGSNIDGQIQGSFLHGTNLTNADLSGVQAQGSDFTGANLTGANLDRAQLQGANLSHANLTNASLKDAKTSGASFSGATWSNTTCPDKTNSNADGGTCQGHLAGGPPGQDQQ
jgi:phospholipase C